MMDYNTGAYNTGSTEDTGGLTYVYGTDSLTVAVTDVPRDKSIITADTLKVASGLDADIGLTRPITTYDALLIAGGGLETARNLTYPFTRSDTLLIQSAFDNSTLGKASADTLAPKITEAQSVSATVTSTDTVKPKVTEVITRAFTSADSLKVAIPDAAARAFSSLDILSIASGLDGVRHTVKQAADSLLTKVLDATSQIANLPASSDAAQVKVTEVTGVTVFLQSFDSLAVTGAGTCPGTQVQASAQDMLTVTVPDEQNLEFTVTGTDTLTLTITGENGYFPDFEEVEGDSIITLEVTGDSIITEAITRDSTITSMVSGESLATIEITGG